MSKVRIFGDRQLHELSANELSAARSTIEDARLRALAAFEADLAEVDAELVARQTSERR